MQKRLPDFLTYPLLVLVACAQAANYQIFILSNSFAPAGINGVATMIQYLFHFSIGYMSLLINLPLCLLVYFKVEKRYAFKTLLFVLAFSGFTLLCQGNVIDMSKYIYHTDDGRSTILAPVTAGAVNGFLYAMAIRLGGCTGGTDLIAAYIHKRNPEYSTVSLILMLNTVVAGLSYFVYDNNIEKIILCILYSLMTSAVSDKLIKGGERAIKVEIITDAPDALTEQLIRTLRHSVTILKAEGGYSHADKSLLICILNPHQLPKISDILSSFPGSFAYLSDVNKTLGNFKRITR